MKRFIHLHLLCVVVLLGSCSGFKNLTAKDVSGSEQSKKKNNSDDATFLDNVSVTPGSKQIISTDVANTKKTYVPSAGSSTKNFEIENASQVQLKYAVMLDVPVEELNNTLLLEAIDHWWGT